MTSVSVAAQAEQSYIDQQNYNLTLNRLRLQCENLEYQVHISCESGDYDEHTE